MLAGLMETADYVKYKHFKKQRDLMHQNKTSPFNNYIYFFNSKSLREW